MTGPGLIQVQLMQTMDLSTRQVLHRTLSELNIQLDRIKVFHSLQMRRQFWLIDSQCL